MDLEAKLAQALEEISHVGHLSAGGTKRTNKDWLPTGHSKYTLSGH
jgi:platelet-activating factor acetylhydrolase IB subunit alpha